MTKKPTVEKTFKVTIEEKEHTLTFVSASLKDNREAIKVYNRAFHDAVASGAMLRLKLDSFAKKQGVLDDAKQQEILDIVLKMSDKQKALDKGGIPIADARQLAIDLRVLRADYVELNTEINQLDQYTAEAQAENAQFNYLLTSALVYNDSKKPVFASLEDYLNKEDQSHAAICAGKFAFFRHGLSENIGYDLPENEFLRDWGFSNESGRLINKDGHLVDAKNRLIDEEGFLVNAKNQRIDADGKLVKEDKFTPFLDEDGKPMKKASASKPKTKVKKEEEVTAEG